jgi:hypothetical protein
MGRPTKRTPEREQRLLEAIRAGNTLRASSAYAGVSEDTLAIWRQRYSDFSESLTRAIAESEVVLVAIVRKAASEDWKAASWLLERRFHESWGKRERYDVEIRRQAEHLGAELGLDPEALIAEAERIAAGRG